MNAITTDVLAPVAAFPVPDQARVATLSRPFERHMLTVEAHVYELMYQYARNYGGGEWRMWELSNGGMYMSPPGTSYELSISALCFKARVSADVAGIIVCLLALKELS